MCACALTAVFCLTQTLVAADASAPPRVKTRADAPGVNELVKAAIAGDYARLQRLADELRARPRPPRGDRRLARELNARGLALWRRQRYEEAAVQFRKARGADASDGEIAENLAYALLKSDKPRTAHTAVLDALALAPERASAWGTLGQILAKEGKHAEGVACMLTAYRYTHDRERALDVYARLARTDDDPRVRAMLAEVISRLSSRPDAKRS